MSSSDLVFHLLDLQSRDIRIEREEDDIRECVYESEQDESDDEIGYRNKKKQNTFNNQQREFVSACWYCTNNLVNPRISLNHCCKNSHNSFFYDFLAVSDWCWQAPKAH